MITQIIKFIRILASEASPMQISIGISLAMIVGLTPLFSLHNLLVICVLLAFRINLAAFLLALAFFSGMAYLLDPIFHNMGLSVLNHPALLDTWTTIYNSTFWKLTHFNNTILMGSLIFSLLAFIPVVLILNVLIRLYRTQVFVYLKKSKLLNWLQKSKIVTRFTSLAE